MGLMKFTHDILGIISVKKETGYKGVHLKAPKFTVMK